MPHLKTYSVIYAEDVPHYASAEIEARTPKAAIAKARKLDTNTFGAYDPDWGQAVCRRIVSIEDEAGNDIARDMPLDNYRLEHLTDENTTIRHHAKELLEALERAHTLLDRIADICHYEDGLPVTFLEARDIETIHGDATTELAPIETLIRKARGET
jgi:hypothetical protein